MNALERMAQDFGRLYAAYQQLQDDYVALQNEAKQKVAELEAKASKEAAVPAA